MAISHAGEKSDSETKKVSSKIGSSNGASSSSTSKSKSKNKSSARKTNNQTKRATFTSECRGPSDQNVLKKESSGRQQTEDKDSLLDYLTNMTEQNNGQGNEELLSEANIVPKFSTDELRQRVSGIMRVRTPENVPSYATSKDFVSDLLNTKDSEDDNKTIDGDLSISSTTLDGASNRSILSDVGSILSEDYSQRSNMIDSMLANMRSRRPTSAGSILSQGGNLSVKQDLERNGVLFVQTPTGSTISITHDASLTREDASAAISSKTFNTWIQTTSKTYGAKRFSIMKLKILEVERNEIGNVGTIKLQVEGKLRDEEAIRAWKNIKEICFLRQETLGLLVSLICIEDGSQWSLLVDSPSLPIGRPSALALPSITFDDISSTYMGEAIRPMRSLCDIEVDEHELVNLAEETYNEKSGLSNVMGMTPDPTASSESFKFLYLSKRVTKKKLQQIRKNVSEARDEGTGSIALRVIPTNDIWKVSTDMKVMCALFLLNKKFPPSVQSRPYTTGGIAKPRSSKGKEKATVVHSGNPTPGLDESQAGMKGKLMAFLQKSWDM